MSPFERENMVWSADKNQSRYNSYATVRTELQSNKEHTVNAPFPSSHFGPYHHDEIEWLEI